MKGTCGLGMDALSFCVGCLEFLGPGVGSSLYEVVRFGPGGRGVLSISLSLSVDPHSFRNLLLFATGSNHFSGSEFDVVKITIVG